MQLHQSLLGVLVILSLLLQLLLLPLQFLLELSDLVLVHQFKNNYQTPEGIPQLGLQSMEGEGRRVEGDRLVEGGKNNQGGEKGRRIGEKSLEYTLLSCLLLF